MTDPRTPENKRKDAQLPDDLDQIPAADPARGLSGQHGSEDAQLLVEAGREEGKVERETPGDDPGEATP